MATKDSTSAVLSKSTTTPTGEESVTPVSQLSGLGELSASMVTKTDRRLEAIQRAQVGSLVGADKTKEPQEKIPKKLSPTLATRPKKYALEMWVEIETSPGMYSTPEDDSYSINFAIDAINHAYPGYIGMYLDMAGHMLAFYGKKTNPRAGLLHNQGIVASKTIADIPSWMGYPVKWRVQCVIVSEASEILAGCKRLEKENWRRACWDLQNRVSSMQLNSPLSATTRPFQPQAAPSSTLVDNIPRDYPARNGLARGSPTMGITVCQPAGRALLNHRYTSDEEGVPTDTTTSGKSLCKRHGGRGNRGNRSGSDSKETPLPGGRWKKKDGFSSKIQIPEFGGKKGHPHDVADAFRQWARCIMYYHKYYDDSYLMPLVVSSLTGDASDMFDWIHSVTPGGTQDLSALLQMLREHYCGPFTFREQRNMVENLCQGAHEDATDFMIRVDSSVGNLAKDWKGQFTEAELQSLQYEVSLNGVREEIWHVLDSEIARHGQLTPHQIYEAAKRYETYVARNKHLKGKSASPHVGHQRAAAQNSGYKPRFHKTTAFATSVKGSPDPALPEQEPSLPEDDGHLEVEPTQEEDEGLYIPSFLEEALGGDGNLQIKMARTLQAQERCDKKCFLCQSGDHLMKDHYKVKMGQGPYSQRGLPKTSQLRRQPKPLHLVK